MSREDEMISRQDNSDPNLVPGKNLMAVASNSLLVYPIIVSFRFFVLSS